MQLYGKRQAAGETMNRPTGMRMANSLQKKTKEFCPCTFLQIVSNPFFVKRYLFSSFLRILCHQSRAY